MKRLEEACRILIALWTEPRATSRASTTRSATPIHEPKPVQRPHPPLVIGTSGERVGLRIAARHAQTWNMARATPDEFRKKSALLDAYCREIGRDPAEIERSIQFLPDAMTGDVVGARPRVHRRRRHAPDLQLPHALQRRRRAPRLGRHRDEAPRLAPLL